MSNTETILISKLTFSVFTVSSHQYTISKNKLVFQGKEIIFHFPQSIVLPTIKAGFSSVLILSYLCFYTYPQPELKCDSSSLNNSEEKQFLVTRSQKQESQFVVKLLLTDQLGLAEK